MPTGQSPRADGLVGLQVQGPGVNSVIKYMFFFDGKSRLSALSKFSGAYDFN
jgi:hypothetical protein